MLLRLCCGLKLASATTPLFTHRKRTFYEPQRSPFVGAERQPRHIYDAALLITGTRALSESDFRQPPKPGYRTHSAAQLADGHVLGNETTQEKPVAGVRRRSEWALMAGWACRWLTAGSCSALVLPGRSLERWSNSAGTQVNQRPISNRHQPERWNRRQHQVTHSA